MALSVEARLLLSTATGGALADERIRGLLEQPVDWRKLIALSLTEGAQPVLWRRIRESGPRHVPRDVAEALRQIERVADFRLAYLHTRLAGIATMFSSAGVPIILLKGAALSHTVYGSPADRPMADIDLLIQPERAEEARALLREDGWERRYDRRFDEWYRTMHHHHPPLIDTRVPQLEVGLDLHTELFSAQRNPFHLSASALWADAPQLPRLPKGTFAPSLVHQLLHCCLHYAWSHKLSGAAWRTFRDIDAISRSRRLDWEAFLQSAALNRGTASCYWSLQLARSLVDAPVPDHVLSRLRPGVPAAVLRALLHHFEHEAVVTERVCPSSKVRTAIWKAAVRPRRWVHGPTDVESASPPWHLLKTGPLEADTLPAHPRPAYSARAWMRYLRAVA